MLRNDFIDSFGRGGVTQLEPYIKALDVELGMQFFKNVEQYEDLSPSPFFSAEEIVEDEYQWQYSEVV